MDHVGAGNKTAKGKGFLLRNESPKQGKSSSWKVCTQRAKLLKKELLGVAQLWSK